MACAWCAIDGHSRRGYGICRIHVCFNVSISRTSGQLLWELMGIARLKQSRPMDLSHDNSPSALMCVFFYFVGG